MDDDVEELRRHRLRYRFNGFPVYDEFGDRVQVGIIAEPQWRWDDLTPAQRAEVQAFADTSPMGGDDPMRWALAEYGIACVHVWKRINLKWRECHRCLLAEQLPGRVVHIGGEPMLVPDPPPPVWRALGCGAEVLEYHWDGRQYNLRSKP